PNNTPPVLLPVGDQTVAVGQPFALQLSAVDPDGDAISYSGTNLPPGATLDPASGLLRFTPTVTMGGATVPRVVPPARAGSLTSSETIQIAVTAAALPPGFVRLVPQAGREGTPLQFTLTAADPDGDPLSFSPAAPLPAGAHLNPFSGQFQWTPNYD